jgi:uncharacterized OB-fold protein
MLPIFRVTFCTSAGEGSGENEIWEVKQMTTAEEEKKPLKSGLWNYVSDQVHLIGSKCNSCGEVYFPRKENHCCPHCQHRVLTDLSLSQEGIITTFTIVYQQPAGGFYTGPVPYAYGIVQLPDGVNVETLFTGCQLEKIKTGLKAHLVIDKLCNGDDGSEVLTYKFVPVLELGGKP